MRIVSRNLLPHAMHRMLFHEYGKIAIALRSPTLRGFTRHSRMPRQLRCASKSPMSSILNRICSHILQILLRSHKIRNQDFRSTFHRIQLLPYDRVDPQYDRRAEICLVSPQLSRMPTCCLSLGSSDGTCEICCFLWVLSINWLWSPNKCPNHTPKINQCNPDLWNIYRNYRRDYLLSCVFLGWKDQLTGKLSGDYPRDIPLTRPCTCLPRFLLKLYVQTSFIFHFSFCSGMFHVLPLRVAILEKNNRAMMLVPR